MGGVPLCKDCIHFRRRFLDNSRCAAYSETDYVFDKPEFFIASVARMPLHCGPEAYKFKQRPSSWLSRLFTKKSR